MNDLVFYDLETTGANAAACRIVEMCFADEHGVILHEYVNPQRVIEKSASDVHGITTAEVSACPPFKHFAPQVQMILDDAEIMVGYNNYKFDSVVLDRELRDAGFPGFARDDAGVIVQPEADLFTMWKRHEKRTLETAARRFAGYDLTEAHSASADTTILPAVLAGMIEYFGLDYQNIVEDSQIEGALDREGKFRKREDGVVVFAFGKNKDQPVTSHRGYLEWMLGKDFSPEVKSWCRRLLRS